MTAELLEQVDSVWSEAAAQALRAAATAPNAEAALSAGSVHTFCELACPRRHGLPHFSCEAAFGKGGALLASRIEQYNFETVHPMAKQHMFKIDLVTYGMESLGLLLWWGDLKMARVGFAKVLDAHKRMLANVQSGVTGAEACFYEAVVATFHIVPALLAAGDLGLLRDFLANSIAGAAVDDEVARKYVSRFWEAFCWR